jgi:hypothetical protein
MNRFFSTLLTSIGVFGAMAFASTYAEAQYRHHNHRGRVGVYIGAPLLLAPWYYHPRPYYYDPYYPYHRPVIVQEQPVVYVEQGQGGAPESSPPVAPPQAQQQQQQYWYFCQDTQTYYPHVQNCATPWQRVIPYAPR